MPGYHWVYEIILLLNKKRSGLEARVPDIAERTRKEVLSVILQKYSEKAPEDFLNKAREELKR